jgi:hypothetical protein
MQSSTGVMPTDRVFYLANSIASTYVVVLGGVSVTDMGGPNAPTTLTVYGLAENLGY